MGKLVVVSGSSRDNGNSEALLQIAVENKSYELVKLREKEIFPIVDHRHDGLGFQPLEDDYYEVIQKVIHADEVLFVTPVYWYSMSGLMKDFIDRFTESLRSPEYNFKEIMKSKTFYIIAVGANKDKTIAEPIIRQFEYIARYFGATFGGAVIGTGDRPGDVLLDTEAVDKAKALLLQ